MQDLGIAFQTAVGDSGGNLDGRTPLPSNDWLMKRNCSLTPRQAGWFYFSIVCFSTAIAVFFAVWLGAWLVLPFAGLELLGLGIALLAYARNAADYERVSVTDGMLVVETASASRITREVFNPRWVRVELGESFRAPVVLRSDKRSVQVGLYLDPPEKALVLCVDEKSQIQALDRSAPVLPMMPGMPERRTHDYVRHGITTLFAALDVATGEVYGSIHRRHRAIEFKKFLTKLDNTVPADLDVHLICDNYSTHKSPTVTKWLAAHPRFHMHFTPTYSSWLNQVERWFGLLTDQKLRRGVHRSIQALEKDIREWIADWNDNPRPFNWTKTADEIFERLGSYLQRIPGAGH